MKPVSKKNKFLTCSFLLCLSLVNSLKLSAQITADFSSSLLGGCSPILVNFTDLSTGSPVEWKWDLGNGTFSNLQNPSVTYFNPGRYTVKLFVKNAGNRDSVVKVNYITVFQAPVVNFQASTTTGCNPLTVKFTDQSASATGNLSSWQWDFGDGVLSSQQQPSHVYTSTGNFSVTLKISNTNGCSSTFRQADLITNNGIKAAFTYGIINNCTPTKLAFKSTSVSNGAITYKWDFGDGQTSALAAPVHDYITGGNYTVKLFVSSVQGCTDSLTYNIDVRSAVSSAFSADNVKSCKAPFTVHFANQTLSGNNYLWDFGDSSFSALANPVHDFMDTGSYTVKLVVRNNNGCVDSVKKTAFIVINKPLSGFSNLPDSSCTPFTKTMSALTNSAVNIVQYKWDFGDGSSSVQRVPTHTFTNAGYYNISLAVTAADGCIDTFLMPAAIRVTTKPVANFSANVTSSCASSIVLFSNLSSNASSWVWDFGDNTLSFDKTPDHTFRDTGYRTVILIAINGGCADTAKIEKFIYIKPAVAKFNLLLNCSQPLVRSFYNYSIGANNWRWDFGDGTGSSENSPVHLFPGPGIYPVKLIVKNDTTGCEFTLTKQVTVLNVKAAFSATDSVVCRGQEVYFSSPLKIADVARFYWDFGDGSYIYTKESSTSHAYAKAGKYSVRLITIDWLNCRDTIVKPLYITVSGPKANFGIEKNTCFGTPVIFADSSKMEGPNSIAKWVWNYGDGVIDTFQTAPFQHIYSLPASYKVSLKVTDTKGCSDSFSLPVSLIVNKLIARIYAMDSLSCPGMPVKFLCPYWMVGIKYRWDFGDGDTSAVQIPYHAYRQAGIYTIKMLIKDSNGCEERYTLPNAVRIVNPVASFSMSDSFRTCPPLVIQFTSNSQNALEEYWDFGDSSHSREKNPSHFYTYPGVYTATLYAKGPGGCINTMQRTITVKGPKGSLSYDPLKLCRPYLVNFKAHTSDAVSYVWDFNDGTTLINNDSAVQHAYRDSGIFIPKIMLIDDIGCRVPITGKDTIINFFATAKFSFPDKVLCDQDAVHLTNLTFSNDSISSYRWDFGNGNISSEKEPDYHYNMPGLYYPSLKVTTRFGCTDQYKSVKPIKAALSTNAAIEATANGCAPLTVSFKGIKLSTDTAAVHWTWQMANGHTDTLQNPSAQLYVTGGVYTISLTTVNSNGCAMTAGKIIEAYAVPVLQLPAEGLVCKGQSISLQANGAATYSWFPATGLSCTACSTTVASPQASLSYIVTGTSLHGCVSSDSVAVKVKQPFKMRYSAPDKLCAGITKRLQASGAAVYKWSPATGLNSTSSAMPEARPDTTTIYTVVGTDDTGCFHDTGYVQLTVYPLPTVTACEDKTITVGSSVDLEAKFSSDVTEVNWTPTGDNFRNNENAITVKPTTNTEYIVDVKNAGGCAARDRVNVLVVCNGSNVFLPNLFSPNGDGANDIFYPRGTGLYKIKSLRVFNRWGEAVFEKSSFNANDPSSGWDGTYKGTKLNADTFVYMMELICDNNSILSLKGNVALVR